jgi:hypothetical protein
MAIFLRRGTNAHHHSLRLRFLAEALALLILAVLYKKLSMMHLCHCRLLLYIEICSKFIIDNELLQY